MISQKYIKNSDLQIFPPEIQAEKTPSQKFEGTDVLEGRHLPPPGT